MTQKSRLVQLRPIEQDDLDAVFECEVSNHTYMDSDFGVPQLAAYAWTKDDMLDAIRQYAQKAKGINETRAFVAEHNRKVCGAIIYEIQQDGFLILLFTSHKNAPKDTKAVLLDKVLQKAYDSELRKKLTIYIPDGDYANLAFFKEQGWDIKLITNYWDNDSWKCETCLPIEDEKNSSKGVNHE